MIRNAFAAVACLFALHTPVASADVITDWNQKAVAAAYATGLAGTLGTRLVAITQLAMFEAVNSIEPRYAPYRARLPADKSWPKDVAASSAARAVLAKLGPADKAKEYDTLHQSVLAGVADGAAKSQAAALGEQAAEAMLRERANDGSDAANDYRPATAPGVYVPTQMPIASNWAKTRPFGIARGDQFRAPPPMALSSAQWARDYNEVKRLGAKNGSTRTEEQSRIAKFWEFTGPGTYNPMGVHLVVAKKVDIVDCARAMALLAIVAHDAGLAVFDSKFAHNFWRPVTAIRNGDQDGNDATERDAGWEPYIPTPMHPEYPCAHCTFQSAAATTLAAVFGNEIPEVKLTSTSAPGMTRTFTKLSDYVEEVINARIYDGVHYRTSGEVGAQIGRQIGEYVVANHLRPVR